MEKTETKKKKQKALKTADRILRSILRKHISLTIQNSISNISCLSAGGSEVIGHAVNDTSNNSRFSNHIAFMQSSFLEQEHLQRKQWGFVIKFNSIYAPEIASTWRNKRYRQTLNTIYNVRVTMKSSLLVLENQPSQEGDLFPSFHEKEWYHPLLVISHQNGSSPKET